jgi:hypothetical protein
MRTIEITAMRPPHRRRLLAAVLATLMPCVAGAATLQVGAGRTYALPSAAAVAARDGDHVQIAAGEYFDCAVWRANDLTVEGAGPDLTVITDKVCQGKALFVTTGARITIRNLTLTRARVPDNNGAGIRAEGGDLTIDRVRFINDQDGILAVANPDATLVIRDSVFERNGTCEGGGSCAHGVYVNDLALLRIERTRFFETRQGHHIKSRARRTEVIGCDIADGGKGTSSYAIDVSNGGGVLVRDTRIEKGPNSENHTGAIVVGAEGVTQRTPDIVVENTTFRVDGDYPSFLVVNMTATEARLTGNTLVGGGAKALHGDGSVE